LFLLCHKRGKRGASTSYAALVLTMAISAVMIRAEDKELEQRLGEA
jgi:hypothetical protein